MFIFYFFRTLAIIKPDAYMWVGRIISIIQENGILITNLKMCKLTNQDANKFLSNLKDKGNFKEICLHLSSDLIVVLQLTYDNCVNKWLHLMGPSNPQIAKKQAPHSIRATFGQDEIKNAVYGSESSTFAVKDLEFFFSRNSIISCPAYFTTCSCLVIKPHIVSEGKVGKIIDILLSSTFEISAMQLFELDKSEADEFLDIYRNLMPEYNQIVNEMSSGPCIALQVRHNNVVASLREVCGPHDPQMARSLRPKSIRAILGKDKVKNAVHCTDLPEDALIEVEYFFVILQK